tara:strand:- start:1132 stop:1695 length:564 start_codon:yes stop_codon:yes gene_type:complete
LLALACGYATLGFDYLDPVARKVKEGTALYNQGKFAEALAAYREAQVDRPEADELRFNAGDALYQGGSLDEAMALFIQVSESAVDSLAASAYHNLGNVYFKKQEFVEAAEAYQAALKFDPGQLDTKINLEITTAIVERQRMVGQMAKDLVRTNRYKEALSLITNSTLQTIADSLQKEHLADVVEVLE